MACALGNYFTLKIQESTLSDHEVRKELPIWMKKQIQEEILSYVYLLQRNKANLWAFH